MSALPACVCAPVPHIDDIKERYASFIVVANLLKKRVEDLCHDKRGLVKTFFHASLPNSMSFVTLYNALCSDRPDLTTCSTCASFYSTYGTVVIINKDLSLTSLLWDASVVPESNPYRPLVAALQAAVESPDNDIASAFVWPANPTGSQTKSKHGYPHWAMYPPVAARYNERETLVSCEGFVANLAEARKGLERALYQTYNADTLTSAVTLAETKQFGRDSIKILPQASFLHKTMVAATAHWPQSAYNVDNTTCPVFANRALWLAVASAAPGWCFPASNLIGQVYSHLANGDSIEVIKRSLALMTAPLQYQRPQAAASAGEVVSAERAFEKLALTRAMARRVAAVADVSKAGWASWVAPLAPIAEWESDRKTPELRASEAAADAAAKAEAEEKGKQGQSPGAAAAPADSNNASDKSRESDASKGGKAKAKSKGSLFSVCSNSKSSDRDSYNNNNNKGKGKGNDNGDKSGAASGAAGKDAADPDSAHTVGYHELVASILPTATAMWVQVPSTWYFGSVTTQSKYNAPPVMKWDVTAAMYKSTGEAVKSKAEEACKANEAEAEATSENERKQADTNTTVAAADSAVPEADAADAAAAESDKEDDEDYAAAKAAAEETAKAAPQDAKDDSNSNRSSDNKDDKNINSKAAAVPDLAGDKDGDCGEEADDTDVDEFGGRDCECEYAHASDCAHPAAAFDRETARNPFDFYIYASKSTAAEFSLSLTPTVWHPCTAVLRRPAHFRDAAGHPQEASMMLLALAGARDIKSSKMALFPGSLRSDLHGVRRVIEEFSNNTDLGKVPAQFQGREASGVTLWETQASQVAVRVQDKDGSVKQYTLRFAGYKPVESAF